MEYLVVALVVIVLLLVLLLVLHLVDRVSRIEKQARELGDAVRQTAQGAKGPMAGLGGRALWDTLTGKQASALPADELQQLRERYAAVLERHIEALFNDGSMDARMGVQAEPPNTRTIAVLRGEVESWLPAAQASTLYQCGADAGRADPQELQTVRERLEEAVQYLYTKVQLTPSNALVSRLLPMSENAPETSPPAVEHRSPGTVAAAPPGSAPPRSG